jgi:GNAT superfamily N-acetyltransferase
MISGMSVTFRKAERRDAPAIVEFQISMARETEDVTLDRATCTRGVEAIFEQPGLGTYYVAVDQDRVAGSLLITYEWSDWRNRMVWWIQSVYIHRDFRRQGIYAGLYEYVKGLAERDEGIGGIRLYVDKRNTLAQQVYTRLGMNGEHYSVFEWMK